LSKATFVREATGLVREFGPMMALMMAMNNMIGAGIWGLSVRMPYTYPGSDPTLAFIIGLIPAFFFAISYAWLASCMPRAGGDYVFISRTTNPALGYVVTIGNFLGRWFSIGFLLYTDVTLWAIAFRMLGKGTGNASLADFGAWLAAADPTVKIACALFLLFTVWLFLTIGGTAFKAYTAIIWLVPIVGAIACIFLSYANPFNPTSFQNAWDSVWGNGSYAEIVSIAQKYNWSPAAPNFDATIRAVAGAALFAYSGFHNPAQWSGEIKNPKRNLLIGIIGGTLITAVIYITMAASAFYAGGEFISQYNWAYYKGTAADFVITPRIEPVLPMFGVIFAGGNVFLTFLIATAGAFSLYHVQPAALMMETRRVFSLAFDRLFPERFANVSERFHTPTWAILFMVIGGAIGIIISSPVLGPLRTLAGGINATFMYLLGYLFTGLALALLPITKPEIYESIKVEVGGVPVPAICGVAAFALGIFFFAANAQSMAPLDIFISCLVLGIGLALYIYYAYKNKKMGIDLKTLLSEIPPE
jgi:amino acid transporter